MYTEEQKQAILNTWEYMYGNFILWGPDDDALIGTCKVCAGVVDHRSFRDHERWHEQEGHGSLHPGRNGHVL